MIRCTQEPLVISKMHTTHIEITSVENRDSNFLRRRYKNKESEEKAYLYEPEVEVRLKSSGDVYWAP